MNALRLRRAAITADRQAMDETEPATPTASEPSGEGLDEGVWSGVPPHHAERERDRS